MSQFRFEQKDVFYRAVCQDDRYRGPRRKKPEQAFEDKDKHKAKPGNEDHIVKVIEVRERFIMQIMGS